jgi:LCP family protein required for cell wall assembly
MTTLAPPTAPPEETPAQPSRPRLSRRTRRLVFRALPLGLVVLLIVVFGGGYLYVSHKVSQIHRISVSGLAPVTGPSEVFLLAGSDSRAGESAAQAAHFGSATQVAGARSDVIVLVRIDTSTGAVSMLSIPRDMFVPIAGTGSSNRINVAFNTGPSLLVATISQAFGIPINHFAEISFDGLQQLTDAVGGVCMNFPFPVRDGSPTGTGNESGLSIPTAGPHVLNGAMALALVRSRYYQYLSHGYWQAEGTGDIGRITRQHEYMRALASKLVHSSLYNPFTAISVLGKGVQAVTVDSTLGTNAILGLGWHLRSVKPSTIPSWTMPYYAYNSYGGYGDVLMPSTSADHQVISQWESYAPPSSSPATTAAPRSSSGGPAGAPAAGTSVPGLTPAPPWDPTPC